MSVKCGDFHDAAGERAGDGVQHAGVTREMRGLGIGLRRADPISPVVWRFYPSQWNDQETRWVPYRIKPTQACGVTYSTQCLQTNWVLRFRAYRILWNDQDIADESCRVERVYERMQWSTKPMCRVVWTWVSVFNLLGNKFAENQFGVKSSHGLHDSGYHNRINAIGLTNSAT